MAIGSSSGRRVSYIAEVTPGTTPATPTFQNLRITGGPGLAASKVTAVSDEVRLDRNVSDVALMGVDASGNFDFEFSYGTFDDMLSAVLCADWATNAIKNGLLQKYFTFEETLEMGATDYFFRFPKARVNTFSLDMASRGKITGSMSLMAERETPAQAIIAGATYTAANTNAILTASRSVAALAVAGLNPAPKVRRLSLEINNGLRTRPVVGSLYSEEYGEGRLEVTGTLEAYFESMALYQLVIDHGGGAITATLGDTTLQKYNLNLPRVKFMDGRVTRGGNNDDVTVNIPFQALYDNTLQASIGITRAIA